MKRLFLVLLIVLLTIFTGQRVFRHNITDKTEVVFWTLQMSGFADYINGIISEYETVHPNIKIKWIDVPFSEGEKRTLASILSNNPPDLVNLNPDFSSILAQKGALEFIPEERLSEFNKDVVESLKYNGKLFAVPWYATSAITIYNKKLYKKSGLKTLPATYEDLAKISRQVKQNAGCYAYFPTITENDTMLKILNKYGVNSADNIANDESIRIFGMYKKLYQDKLIPAESITQTHQEALEKYMSESVIFYQGGANFLSMIKDNAPDVYKNTEVAPQIVGKLGQNDFSLMNFIIPVRAKNKKEALDFCLFLTNKENQLKLAKRTNVISTNKYALKDEFYNSDMDVMARARNYSAKQISNIQPVMRQKNNQKDINLLVNTAVQSVLLGKGDIKQILEDVARNWKGLE
ncbi:MAG: extracellular solute-binding protein [Candidatus Gastranaerophilales bacterium]|nr:extracellular solute-binding protein [Candidatus Gastranaerophilales bacterium]